ncbi:hypothetical protein [Geobacter sp. DSM 9736]|uniref:hypothetical protein n=1 Tax=Geobacter sp. DSM 9736 TaxID=1277350 RepID=UPI000B504499|nr:hypothetical protein [Geobacter sp. DSM 9736]SNB47362.1 hypothetical protein SAMN06269301_2843 [Geobacter sp. DSM 9736]
MKTEELILFSKAVAPGTRRYVRHTKSRREGVVLYLDHEEVEVQVGGRREVWKAEECEAVEEGGTA